MDDFLAWHIGIFHDKWLLKIFQKLLNKLWIWSTNKCYFSMRIRFPGLWLLTRVILSNLLGVIWDPLGLWWTGIKSSGSNTMFLDGLLSTGWLFWADSQPGIDCASGGLLLTLVVLSVVVGWSHMSTCSLISRFLPDLVLLYGKEWSSKAEAWSYRWSKMD